MTHQIVGVGLAAVTARAADVTPQLAAAMLGAAWVGSLLPDADLAGARIHRRTRLERRLLLARATGALARIPLRLLAVLPHRGITHSVAAFALITAAAIALVSRPVGLGLALGYGAHIAADACTPGGVRAWAPFSSRRAWLLPAPVRIPTGSLRESALTVLLSGALVAAALLFHG